ncbi:N-acetyltransferase [Pseudomonas syringae pv. maculicola]|nr:N-acetyltransferase [Pseudomonas syringae pv. maculicola]
MDDESTEVNLMYVIDSALIVNLNKYRFAKSFDCGLPVINKYYHDNLKRALVSENVSCIGACSASAELIGFCTLTFHELDRGLVKDFLPEGNIMPAVKVIKLAMLGVDAKYQGFGIGRHLLMTAFQRVFKVHGEIPVKGIFLDAAPNALGFYKALGFQALDEPDEHGSTPMFLHIKYVKAAVQAAAMDSPK